jgi:hypothetical protein
MLTYISPNLLADQSPLIPLFVFVVIYAFVHSEQKFTCHIKPETFLIAKCKVRLEINHDKRSHNFSGQLNSCNACYNSVLCVFFFSFAV